MVLQPLNLKIPLLQILLKLKNQFLKMKELEMKELEMKVKVMMMKVMMKVMMMKKKDSCSTKQDQ